MVAASVAMTPVVTTIAKMSKMVQFGLKTYYSGNVSQVSFNGKLR